MKRLAIIPAREGSKRIPGKNVRPFRGRPVVWHAIEVARATKLFDEVMVSTNSPEIADVARQGGATVPFLRSASASTDWATTAEVLIEVLAAYAELGRMFDAFCCIYPVTPLLEHEHLVNAHRMLEKTGVDSVQPVVRFSYPPQRGVRVAHDGRIEWLAPEHALTRSQDLEVCYHDAGQFYWWKTEAFLRVRALVGANTFALLMSEMHVQDIDTEIDWNIAEAKFQFLSRESGSSPA